MCTWRLLSIKTFYPYYKVKRMIKKLTERYPQLMCIQPEIEKACTTLCTAVMSGRKIMTCGNGGSAADAEHIVGELMKSFLLPRPLNEKKQRILTQAFPEHAAELIHHLEQGIPALSLVSGVALPTAFINDVSAEFLFAQQVLALGKEGDVLWGISTSGNSKNIIQAFRVARAFGITTLGLTGGDGGQMSALCDIEICVPATCTPDIQELHLPVYHTICAQLEKQLF